ncbi:MAG: hypothetical protein M3179_05695, partial [Actinomycetota bacterium]|nr:hypothetical protein [Actinomycetota bacterium]
SCGTSLAAPLNSNRDGPSPVLPATFIEAASGITGAAFCSGCGLGPEYEGRLLYVDYDYRNGLGEIRAATLSADRSSVVSDVVAYRPPGPSPLSIERGPDGALYYSDSNSIHTLVGTATTTTTTTTAPSSTTTTTAPSSTTTTTAPSSTTGTPLVSSFTPTNLRRDFDGWVGMRVVIGSQDVQVSSVGRWVVSGNGDPHPVKLVDAATGADVAEGRPPWSPPGPRWGRSPTPRCPPR